MRRLARTCLTSPGAVSHKAGWTFGYGRLAQRESTRFTRVGSLVRSQHRPPSESVGYDVLGKGAHWY